MADASRGRAYSNRPAKCAALGHHRRNDAVGATLLSMADGPILDDGSYEALVVDASPAEDDSVSLDLTIVAGPNKGHVVTIRATGLGGDPLDLLGMPATIVVAEGRPKVTFVD